MSVVIRDIDKPRDCDYCHFQTDSYCHVLLSYINVEHGVDTRCPIIEINEYTMKNGHKVVVADTPQTEILVKTPQKSRDSHEIDTPQTESTGSPIGDYRDGVGAWRTDCDRFVVTDDEGTKAYLCMGCPNTDCPWG